MMYLQRKSTLSLLTLMTLAIACGDDTTAGTGDGGTETDGGTDSGMATDETITSMPSSATVTESDSDTMTTSDTMTGTTTGTTDTDGTDTDATDTDGAMCGDGIAEGDEPCDGDDLLGEDCVSQGFDEGTLSCAQDCSLDTSECVMFTCGNDAIEGKEVCDGTDLAGEDCASQGLVDGTLACAENCGAFDTSGCLTCGNGQIDGDDVCDGDELGGETCLTQGFAAGTLACANDCAGYDVSGCTNALQVCSTPEAAISNTLDPVIDTVSVDIPTDWFVTDVNVLVDASHTFVGDLLLSVRQVELDASTVLADDICGAAEDIDAIFDQQAAAAPDCVEPIAIEGSVLPQGNLDSYVGYQPGGTTNWELTIADLGSGDDGTLHEWCVEVEVAEANPASCGNDMTELGETCDGADLEGATCDDFGFPLGTLACDADCMAYDTSGCETCGDAVIQAPDVCDATALDGTRCEDLGFVGGSLDCEAGCAGFDTTECSDDVIAMCASPGAAIPDNGSTTSTIVLAAAGNVGDVDVFVDISHDFMADIDLSLRHVATDTIVDLSSDQCSSLDDMLAFFNDEADALPDCIDPIAIEGNVQAEGSLADFDGLLTPGAWELIVADDDGGITGTLNEWCIYVTPQ